ncbi:DMT family transporter [Streptomyces sp. NPDC050564]|uniref:DMT family transporter n=1 Tax=Streptomyces sp. NPDC050564 TaxID=3365631 RepID=UPI0037962B92
MFSVLTLGVASALAYAGAAVAQRAVASYVSERGRRGVLRGAAWWVSLLLNSLGAALHAAALRFGSLVAVQMLGVLTLVAAPLLSAAVLRRRMSRAQCSGIAFTVAGVVGLLFLTRSAQSSRTLAPSETAGVVGLTVAVLAISTVAAAVGRRMMTTSLWYAVAAGVAFGAASALTQTAVLELTDDGALRLPVSAVVLTIGVICLAVGGLILCQLAYRGGLEAPLATMTLVNPVFAAVIGAVVLGDRYATGIPGALAGLAAAAAAGRGVFVLAHTRSEARTRPEAPVYPEAYAHPEAWTHSAATVPERRLSLGQPVEVDLDGGHEPLDEFLEVE